MTLHMCMLLSCPALFISINKYKHQVRPPMLKFMFRFHNFAFQFFFLFWFFSYYKLRKNGATVGYNNIGGGVVVGALLFFGMLFCKANIVSPPAASKEAQLVEHKRRMLSWFYG